MLSQVAQFAPEFNVILEEASVDLRATFDSAAKYGLSNNSTAFQQVVVKINLQSPTDPEQVRRLVAHAERGCHTSQTFLNPVPVTIEAQLNREPL